MTIKTLKDAELTDAQSDQLLNFEVECFNDEKVREYRNTLYFSKAFCHLLLYNQDELISYLRIIKRPTTWKGKSILIGGIGSVATREVYRGQGHATQLLHEAMNILKQENVDIALLQTNIQKGGKLYGSVGFIPANKPYTFYDINNELHTVKAKDVMIAPVINHTLLNDILNSPDLLDIGSGDW